jgi:hypothetical protein
MDKVGIEAAINVLESWGRTIDNWVLIFAGLVAICLTVEVVFSVAHWLNEKQLRPLRAQLSQLNAKEIAELNNETAKLRQQLAPRVLTADQQKHITESVKLFPGIVFDSGSLNDKEPLDLLEQIEPALIAAGWKEIDWANGLFITRHGRPTVGMLVDKGISIQFDMSQKATLDAPANALAAAIRAAGLEAAAEFSPPNITTTNTKAIHVVVGKKP